MTIGRTIAKVIRTGYFPGAEKALMLIAFGAIALVAGLLWREPGAVVPGILAIGLGIALIGLLGRR